LDYKWALNAAQASQLRFEIVESTIELLNLEHLNSGCEIEAVPVYTCENCI